MAGVPDRLLHCVEDAQRSAGPMIEYIFHRLPTKAFVNLILRIKQLFPPQYPVGAAVDSTLGDALGGGWQYR